MVLLYEPPIPWGPGAIYPPPMAHPLGGSCDTYPNSLWIEFKLGKFKLGKFKLRKFKLRKFKLRNKITHLELLHLKLSGGQVLDEQRSVFSSLPSPQSSSPSHFQDAEIHRLLLHLKRSKGRMTIYSEYFISLMNTLIRIRC